MSDVTQADVASLVEEALRELVQVSGVGAGDLVVIGASSSEVVGQRIGTAGSADVATAIVTSVLRVRADVGFYPAFQCCEHLNRALVVERTVLREQRLTEVSAVPVLRAGGAVASAAYRTLVDPVLVEHITAHAGIDIGDTLIGMHLRHVAVPVRLRVREIGQAHVTAARTRPKLIGGGRAVYTLEGEDC